MKRLGVGPGKFGNFWFWWLVFFFFFFWGGGAIFLIVLLVLLLSAFCFFVLGYFCGFSILVWYFRCFSTTVEQGFPEWFSFTLGDFFCSIFGCQTLCLTAFKSVFCL